MYNKGYNITQSNDALLLSYDGKWDHQLYIERFGKSILAYTEQFCDKPWTIIDDISNWPIKPPDEIKMRTEVVEKLVTRGLQHIAVFGSEYSVSKWMIH
ncbi:hypothetical protein [Aliiglaciecola sp. M165]|uniref:hypothetical protein n=1 Tax=Aliiglaciecola sp. M165 TaxID=2593649 RepID=UPI00117FFF78|nr:hypothetical protein [Aliiglaciecola sp. M165]TRY32928.1 hypothetical protein FM019_02760 [Aliiglaciecola sp. M165]